MSRPIKVDVPAVIEVNPRLLAEIFCDMDDESQAQFFIEVAAIARTWKNTNVAQWFQVGAHLRKCECSTDDARDLILDIARGVRP